MDYVTREAPVVKTDSFNIGAPTYAERANKGLWGWLKSKEKKALLNQIDHFISADQECRLLDLGCGVGIYADLISKKLLKASITGIDRSSGMIEIFRAKGYKAFHLNLETQPFSEGIFDIIMILGLLEFVKNPQPILSILKTSSDEDTKIFILVPRFTPLNIFYFLYHYFQHTRVFLRSRVNYLKLFSESDFELLNEHRVTPVSRLLVFQRLTKRNLQ